MENIDRKEEFRKIFSADDLMEYMDTYITYGWVSKMGEKNVNTLEGMNMKYKVNSLEKVMETGLGTCIEQAKLINYFFSNCGYQTHIYSSRYYKGEEEKWYMHCFVLIEVGEKIMYFEHSNPDLKGIYYFDSIDEALTYIENGLKKVEGRRITEVDDLPDNLNFYDLNMYINSFDKVIKR